MGRNPTPAKIEGVLKDNPGASRADCARFLKAFGNKHAASKHLDNYLTWRDSINACEAEHESDAELWDYAVGKTFEPLLVHEESSDSTMACSSNGGSEDGDQDDDNSSNNNKEDEAMSNNSKQTMVSVVGRRRRAAQQPAQRHLFGNNYNTLSLPRFLYMHQDEDTGAVMRDVCGHRIIHALPSLLDLDYSPEVYASALAIYVEQLFQNTLSPEDEKVTLMLDVRPGRGWPNAPAKKMIGLICHVANQLNTLHPDRIHKCVLFPTPRVVIGFVNVAIKPFLDPKLRQLIELVHGIGCDVQDPPPNDKLTAFVAAHDLESLEQHRLDCFWRCGALRSKSFCTTTATKGL